MNKNDILGRQRAATPGTRIVAVLLVVATIAWITVLVTRSHHAGAPPRPSTSTLRSDR